MTAYQDIWGWLSLRTLGDGCQEETHGDGSLQGHLGMAVGTHGDVCLKGHMKMVVSKDTWKWLFVSTQENGCM